MGILEELNENVGQYTKSGTQPAQLVGQGEYAVGITWDQAVFDRIEEGYPMEAVIPEEGGLPSTSCGCSRITKKSRRGGEDHRLHRLR